MGCRSGSKAMSTPAAWRRTARARPWSTAAAPSGYPPIAEVPGPRSATGFATRPPSPSSEPRGNGRTRTGLPAPLRFAAMVTTPVSSAGPRGVGAPAADVMPRTFAWSGEPGGDRLRWFAAGLRAAMLDQGYTEVSTPGPEVAVVLHFVDPEAARPYRRKAAPTFVVALAELDETPTDMLRTGYPLLVRGLANLCVMVSPDAGGSLAQFVTLEQG